MKNFLLGLLIGIMTTGCATTRLQPVLTVHDTIPCPAFQDLPFILDNSVPDDQFVCVATFPYQPMTPLVCMHVGDLKKLVASMKVS